LASKFSSGLFRGTLSRSGFFGRKAITLLLSCNTSSFFSRQSFRFYAGSLSRGSGFRSSLSFRCHSSRFRFSGGARLGFGNSRCLSSETLRLNSSSFSRSGLFRCHSLSLGLSRSDGSRSFFRETGTFSFFCDKSFSLQASSFRGSSRFSG